MPSYNFFTFNILMLREPGSVGTDPRWPCALRLEVPGFVNCFDNSKTNSI